MSEDGFRFALAAVREGADVLQTWMAVEEVGWLDKSAEEGWTGVKGLNYRVAPFGSVQSSVQILNFY